MYKRTTLKADEVAFIIFCTHKGLANRQVHYFFPRFKSPTRVGGIKYIVKNLAALPPGATDEEMNIVMGRRKNLQRYKKPYVQTYLEGIALEEEVQQGKQPTLARTWMDMIEEGRRVNFTHHEVSELVPPLQSSEDAPLIPPSEFEGVAESGTSPTFSRTISDVRQGDLIADETRVVKVIGRAGDVIFYSGTYDDRGCCYTTVHELIASKWKIKE